MAVACGGLLGLTILTICRGGYPPLPSKQIEHITVHVSGAVASPGTYEVTKEGGISALLALAEPLPEADLQRPMRLQSEKSGAKFLRIPSYNCVEVEFTGALEAPGSYKLPLGTRICDIAKHVVLLPGVDAKWLKRRGKLRDGEKVEIPYAKAKGTSGTLKPCLSL